MLQASARHPQESRPIQVQQKLQQSRQNVTTLGWVTPGAAIRVSPLYFFLKNLATFFSRQLCGVTPVYLLITVTFY